MHVSKKGTAGTDLMIHKRPPALRGGLGISAPATIASSPLFQADWQWCGRQVRIGPIGQFYTMVFGGGAHDLKGWLVHEAETVSEELDVVFCPLPERTFITAKSMLSKL
jgi:hypothetical protein